MQTIAPLWLWATFVGIVLVSLFIDFVVLRKQGAHEVSVREAVRWSVVWVAASLAFNALFWWSVAYVVLPAVVCLVLLGMLWAVIAGGSNASD